MTIVLKYGGNAMASPETPDPLLDEIAERVRAGERIVVVHGGGPQIDAELVARDIVTERIEGLRVTDGATLEVTERVLGASVNKALVRALLRRGARAVGLTGQDGGLVRARLVRTRDGASLGFVGAVEAVEPAVLVALLAAGFLPIVAPLAVDAAVSTALNVNADTTAGALAGALTADAYIVITDVARVRRDVSDPASTIERLNATEARALLARGIFEGGMRPKIESALVALAGGTKRVVIGAAGARAIASLLGGSGTTLVAD